ncbi:hypothetical protein LWI29_005188 [Acer saccharum]|uniref:Uncharacterized protein n=1 Tax=Acer saccharum TaxID=4024 RepID=A0AA39RUT0_ACESA|nr:hypothetical protein LWI29_005188 [Acer saccharum]KAK1557667.1 hypothetical protein Q3G72_029257 [Acer saccharum]KAK1564695.1 hypothetical protein Q3G72_009378 [Acer saccharum]
MNQGSSEGFTCSFRKTSLEPLTTHGQELADELRSTVGQLGSLIKVKAENIGITDEQAAAVGLLKEMLSNCK